jgi:hypothetical protein
MELRKLPLSPGAAETRASSPFNSEGPNTSYEAGHYTTPDQVSMSLSEFAVLAIIVASAGAFCATAKWLSLATLLKMMLTRPHR